MPQTTKLPTAFLRVTHEGKGPEWVNLANANRIQTLYDGPKSFCGFLIDFGEREQEIQVTARAEVIALAKMLDFSIPGK